MQVVGPSGAVTDLGRDSQVVLPRVPDDLLRGAHSVAPSSSLPTPEEIGRAVVFLASADSSYINGIELFVDGGMAQI
jgi:NAD(P)-dependent dehydrogenase (short-subunit alcohol dehydrogenase family)